VLPAQRFQVGARRRHQFQKAIQLLARIVGAFGAGGIAFRLRTAANCTFRAVPAPRTADRGAAQAGHRRHHDLRRAVLAAPFRGDLLKLRPVVGFRRQVRLTGRTIQPAARDHFVHIKPSRE
jgi:hypothetical protein